MAKKALGKGLGAIISASPTPVEEIEKVVTEHKERVIEIDLDKIIPNPDQPRTCFDESEIIGLAESITSNIFYLLCMFQLKYNILKK